MKFFNLEKKNINFLKKLYTNYPIVFVFLLNKDLVVKISNQDLKNFLFFLKHHTECLFSQLIDLSMIDYVEKKNRFEVFYNLLSLKYNMRLVVSSNLTELTTLESVSQIYPSAQ
jgi:NADH-quinone oxidoreductase subunit C